MIIRLLCSLFVLNLLTMRKSLFFLAVLAGSFSCLSAQAQNTQPANYGVSFAKNYQENDVYHLEVKRARREGYALQVASFSSYTNVIKYATQLQGKWFRNLLLRTDYSADSKNSRSNRTHHNPCLPCRSYTGSP